MAAAHAMPHLTHTCPQCRQPTPVAYTPSVFSQAYRCAACQTTALANILSSSQQSHPPQAFSQQSSSQQSFDDQADALAALLDQRWTLEHRPSLWTPRAAAAGVQESREEELMDVEQPAARLTHQPFANLHQYSPAHHPLPQHHLQSQPQQQQRVMVYSSTHYVPNGMQRAQTIRAGAAAEDAEGPEPYVLAGYAEEPRRARNAEGMLIGF